MNLNIKFFQGLSGAMHKSRASRDEYTLGGSVRTNWYCEVNVFIKGILEKLKVNNVVSS